MYSASERQKDKRSYDERHAVFHGPTWRYPAKRIKPKRVLRWDEEGVPIYEDLPAGEVALAEAENALADEEIIEQRP